MNRWDEIQAVARDIASNVHADEHARDAMADDLIRLCGLMIGAVGKVVASSGESELNDVHDSTFEPDPENSPEEAATALAEFEQEQMLDAAKAHGMYLTGERVQDAAREAVSASVGADLERYNHGPYGRPVWTHTDRRPAKLRPATPVAPRACCYATPCPICRNGAPVGGCCYPLGDVCQSHC